MLNINRLFLRKKKQKQMTAQIKRRLMRSPIDSVLHIDQNKHGCFPQYRCPQTYPQSPLGCVMVSLEVIFWTWTGSLHFLVKRYFYLRIMLNALASLNASIMHKSLTTLRFAIANPIVITNAQTWARYVAFLNLRKNGSGQSLFWFYFTYRTQSVKRLFPKSQ